MFRREVELGNDILLVDQLPEGFLDYHLNEACSKIRWIVVSVRVDLLVCGWDSKTCLTLRPDILLAELDVLSPMTWP